MSKQSGMDFNIFLQYKTENTCKKYTTFQGISKKDYPKWGGWKIISNYKDMGIPVTEIEDELLDTLVKNFYMIEWIKNLNK